MSEMILGLSGTFASGKDTVAGYLVAGHGFIHVSTGDLIRQEVRRRDLVEDRDILVKIGNEMRHEFGSGVLAERAIDEFSSAERLAVSGIRAVGEARAVKEKGGKLIFLDAPVETRYYRLKARGRIGDETDLDEFKLNEERELSSDKEVNQNILGVREMADFELVNDKEQDELFIAVRGLLAQL